MNKGYNQPYPTARPEDDMPTATETSDSESDSDSKDDEMDGRQTMPSPSPRVGGQRVHFIDDTDDGPPSLARPTRTPSTPMGNNVAQRLQRIQQDTGNGQTPLRRSQRLRQGVTRYNPTSGRSYHLNKKEREHPDYKRCYSNMVTDRMQENNYYKELNCCN